MRTVGTVVRGIRTPVVRKGDDLVTIVSKSVIEASQTEGFSFHDKDIIGVTESIVARAAGNYASINAIATDVRTKFPIDTLGVIFPILSRNRFAVCLRGIAKGVKKIVLMLSYPIDEVGNQLFDEDLLEEKGINPWSDVLDEKKWMATFGGQKHPFTGVDYVDYYASVIRETGCEVELVFSNRAETILDYTKDVLACDMHTRAKTKQKLLKAGARRVLTLDEILNTSVDGSGYNEDFGLLGANKATEDSIKLFPRDCRTFVDSLQERMFSLTGKKLEILVYGDGAFKDPVGKIWELADPVVSPAYTSGLDGTPNELKLKYLADNDFSGLSGTELNDAVRASISGKAVDLKGSMASQGTTPRRLPDLIGSLCDLTSGSGDKGTPVVFIQGYFDSYATAE
ncbi:MAG TPA: coenzyme F420-0:L-glutamate ligase [Treponemataceae bacterium]|nr:coenzyme F420-0:L-glutamate ligase [Treponemataceae bacterium]